MKVFFGYTEERKSSRLNACSIIESWKIADVSRQERDRKEKTEKREKKKQGGNPEKEKKKDEDQERNETKDAYI